MQKKFLLPILILATFFINFSFVRADSHSYYNDFELSVTENSSDSLVTSIVNSGVSISSSYYVSGTKSMNLNGNSYIQYNFNSLSSFTISFNFYKNNSASYSRLIYLLGLNREIEVKGNGSNLYINGETSSTWKLNSWNNLVITRDSDNLIRYILNDCLVYTEVSSTAISGIRLGAGSSTSSNLFYGFIDDLSISDSFYNYPYNFSFIPGVQSVGFDFLFPSIEQMLLNAIDVNNIDTSVIDSYSIVLFYQPRNRDILWFDVSFFTANSSHSYVISLSSSLNSISFGPLGSNKIHYNSSYRIPSNFPTQLDVDSTSDLVKWSNTANSFSSGGGSNGYVSFPYSVLYYSNVDIVNSNGDFIASANGPDIEYLGLPDNPYADMDYIDIPISDLYDDDSDTWKPFLKYFKSTNEDNSYNFHLTYIDDSSSNLPSIPLELFINNNVVDIESYNLNVSNSTYSNVNGYGGGFSIGGGSFGGGGGGGRITSSDSCLATDDYTSYNNTLSNDNTYGVLILSPNSCSDLTGKTP